MKKKNEEDHSVLFATGDLPTQVTSEDGCTGALFHVGLW